LRDCIEDVDQVSIELEPITPKEEAKLGIISHEEVETLLRSVSSSDALRNKLRQFVFPTVQQYIQANIEGALPHASEIGRVACRLQWQVLDFCNKELDDVADMASVLAISGRLDRAEATSCEAYMRHTWPDTGEKMLKAVQEVLKYRSCSKRIRRSIVFRD
jgi:hypothetical protein